MSTPSSNTPDTLPQSVRSLAPQQRTFGPVSYRPDSLLEIVATVRYDDRHRNGHNTLSVTGEVRTPRRREPEMSGCIHGQIARHFRELRDAIPFHLCSTDGPLHYLANTTFHAGGRDHNGLLFGEFRPFRDKATGEPLWYVPRVTFERIASATEPDPLTLRYEAWGQHGVGKARELDSARLSALWPDATDEELLAPGLEQRLTDRLPGLLAMFRRVVEALGFTY